MYSKLYSIHRSVCARDSNRTLEFITALYDLNIGVSFLLAGVQRVIVAALVTGQGRRVAKV